MEHWTKLCRIICHHTSNGTSFITLKQGQNYQIDSLVAYLCNCTGLLYAFKMAQCCGGTGDCTSKQRRVAKMKKYILY